MSGQGYLSRIAIGPRTMRWLFRLWPPFRGMGIRVREIAPDFRRVVVELRSLTLNRNWVGTHFGGSMFAMADPFHMIMMMQALGREYVVWDKTGTIRFLKPGRGTLVARFEVTQAMLDEVIAKTASGARFEPTYSVDVVNAEGETVARVEKTLHIRRKGGARESEGHRGDRSSGRQVAAQLHEHQGERHKWSSGTGS